MADNKEILTKLDSLKNKSQFKVPEGYFDKLPDSIMNRINEEEKQLTATEPKHSIFSLFKNQLAIAASFTALFLLAYTAITIMAPESEESMLSESEIYASLEAEITELDEDYLYNLAYNSPTTDITEEIELSEQEIIDFLIEESAELELTTIDF